MHKTSFLPRCIGTGNIISPLKLRQLVDIYFHMYICFVYSECIFSNIFTKLVWVNNNLVLSVYLKGFIIYISYISAIE